MNILDSFVEFLFYLSIVFIPVAGVVIVDHFAVRNVITRSMRSQTISRLIYRVCSHGLLVRCCAGRVRGVNRKRDHGRRNRRDDGIGIALFCAREGF